MEQTNLQRANWGAAAVRAGDPDIGQNEMETSVSDTLANIMHFCAVNGVEFHKAMVTATNHFADEFNEEN